MTQSFSLQQLEQRARQLCQAGRFDEAAAIDRQIVAQQPHSDEAWRNLGDALAGAGRLNEAIAVYRQALSIRPDDVETCNNLGIAFQSAGRIDEAIEVLGRAVALQPRAHQPRCNLGKALLLDGRIDEAITHLRHGISLEPRSAELHNSLGVALEAGGHWIESVDEFKQALALEPDFARAHYNRGLALLRQGEFDAGWREYEWRWRLPGKHLDRRDFSQPRWMGEPLGDKRLLIHAEQGLGDTIQFVRYLPLIKPRFGGRIILAAHPELRRLFTQIGGIDHLWADAKLPEFDLHCPLLSLPMLFKTNLETIPTTIPYLRADPELASQWSARTQKLGRSRKIGLAWAGRADNTRDRERSISLATLAPLLETPNTYWISLQKGPAAAQIAEKHLPLVDWTGDLHDFSDTAALIENLDLVISVDTAVAHLAGAMGKSVWLLLPFVPDWRWMLNRDDSSWYPTMRLFRQRQIGNWRAPIEGIVQALCAPTRMIHR